MNRTETMPNNQSEFKLVFGDTIWSDRFYLFLQEIFHLYPEDQFHNLIAQKTDQLKSDEEIYQAVQRSLKSITPFLSSLRYALPALRKQKRVMSEQVLSILQDRKSVTGYMEIGSTGRYISDLKKFIPINGPVYLMNDVEPGNGLAEVMERGQIRKIGTWLPLDYAPIRNSVISSSLDLVTCHIGLHHCPAELLQEFVASIRRVLKPGGLFIMRDHDVDSTEMKVFASLVHTVFNLGLHESWSKNQEEYRSFRSVDEWVELIENSGFEDLKYRILQDRDPSRNTLTGFVKI